QMRVEVKLLQRRLGITVLLVTHDQVEALTMSDRVAVMNSGCLLQVGTSSDVYDRPMSPFVRDFLGETVIIRGSIVTVAGRRVGVTISSHREPLMVQRSPSPCADKVGIRVELSIRPEHIVVSVAGDSAPAHCGNTVFGVIEALLFVGDRFDARVRLTGGE